MITTWIQREICQARQNALIDKKRRQITIHWWHITTHQWQITIHQHAWIASRQIQDSLDKYKQMFISHYYLLACVYYSLTCVKRELIDSQTDYCPSIVIFYMVLSTNWLELTLLTHVTFEDLLWFTSSINRQTLKTDYRSKV